VTDIAGLIREARLPETVVHVCLRTDLVVPYEQLSDELIRIHQEHSANDSLASPPDTVAIQAEMMELEEQMRAATVPFVLRAIPRLRFRALMAEHPPRKDDQGKPLAADWNGINQSTYYDALIRESVVAPTLDDDLWKKLFEEKLSDRQYQELSDAAWNLSREKVDYPFLLNASRQTPPFAATSKLP
jgi:hypothetical protein